MKVCHVIIKTLKQHIYVVLSVILFLLSGCQNDQKEDSTSAIRKLKSSWSDSDLSEVEKDKTTGISLRGCLFQEIESPRRRIGKVITRLPQILE